MIEIAAWRRVWLWYRSWWDILNTLCVVVFGSCLLMLMVVRGDFFKAVLLSSEGPTDDAKLQVLSILVSGLTAAGLWLLGLGQKRWTSLNRIRFVTETGLIGLRHKSIDDQAARILEIKSISQYLMDSYSRYSSEIIEVHRDTQRHIESILATASSVKNVKVEIQNDSARILDDFGVILTSSMTLALLYSNRIPSNSHEILRTILAHSETSDNAVLRANVAELKDKFLSTIDA